MVQPHPVYSKWNATISHPLTRLDQQGITPRQTLPSPTMSQTATELPLYKCHKQVRAAKITGIGPASSDHTRLHFDEALNVGVDVPLEWATKHKPQIGGYYVQYSDGYTSYSPAKAFEDGYTEAKILQKIEDSWQARVRQEHAELVTKITKLEAYLEPLQTPPAPQPYTIRILFEQLDIMRRYRDILAVRIHNF